MNGDEMLARVPPEYCASEPRVSTRHLYCLRQQLSTIMDWYSNRLIGGLLCCMAFAQGYKSNFRWADSSQTLTSTTNSTMVAKVHAAIVLLIVVVLSIIGTTGAMPVPQDPEAIGSHIPSKLGALERGFINIYWSPVTPCRAIDGRVMESCACWLSLWKTWKECCCQAW